MMTKPKKLILISSVLTVVAIVFAVGAYFGVRIPCLVNAVTGLNCPGCGNTRATVALLKLDFKEMLYYNLFYPFEIFYVIMVYTYCSVNYIRNGRFAYKARAGAIDIIFLAILILWTIIRNTTPLF